jgi:hypothetical protein
MNNCSPFKGASSPLYLYPSDLILSLYIPYSLCFTAFLPFFISLCLIYHFIVSLSSVLFILSLCLSLTVSLSLYLLLSLSLSLSHSLSLSLSVFCLTKYFFGEAFLWFSSVCLPFTMYVKFFLVCLFSLLQ